MTHTHPPLDDRPNANTSPPISAPDITCTGMLQPGLATLARPADPSWLLYWVEEMQMQENTARTPPYAIGGGGSLPSKHELLRNCESLIITSLSAIDATAALAHEWEERSLTGLFSGVMHIAFEPDCIEAYCELCFPQGFGPTGSLVEARRPPTVFSVEYDL
ncbi:hypothetical protein L198_07869 [Cryptococcus wingfieldii CBS 7118]|uniref:Uncharacterized protein n=1 Tax=Cryptococcus wingfieldii CBS 7118 TaxID=1295528 RepID=A0A1E3HUN9_9TREE|nr:hypothetical protein L198_07869 [Cryptococcus wingfieldii CBS 7118]ODN80059.1 hypothetical protein L198_07869 [Cryptococcus wingfieldii CBS 7118]